MGDYSSTNEELLAEYGKDAYSKVVRDLAIERMEMDPGSGLRNLTKSLDELEKVFRSSPTLAKYLPGYLRNIGSFEFFHPDELIQLKSVPTEDKFIKELIDSLTDGLPLPFTERSRIQAEVTKSRYYSRYAAAVKTFLQKAEQQYQQYYKSIDKSFQDGTFDLGEYLD